MTNTATLNTSNKNTNNCGKLKYILRTKQTNNKKELLLSKSSQQKRKRMKEISGIKRWRRRWRRILRRRSGKTGRRSDSKLPMEQNGEGAKRGRGGGEKGEGEGDGEGAVEEIRGKEKQMEETYE